MFPALLLIPLVALLRIFLAWQPGGTFFSTGLPGACPISAVALCAGLFLPRRLALVVPLEILLLSDVVIDWHYGASFFGLVSGGAVRVARGGGNARVVAAAGRPAAGAGRRCWGPPWRPPRSSTW